MSFLLQCDPFPYKAYDEWNTGNGWLLQLYSYSQIRPLFVKMYHS